MNALSTVSLERLIRPIAHAVRGKDATVLGGVLAAMCEADTFTPEFFLPARADRYARKLIWRDPDSEFIVVAMTWAAGQGSPLHDHAGLWGAEIVVNGIMHETAFELTEHRPDGRYGFRRGAHRVCERGTVGLIVPPREHHNFGNAGKTTAHSMHVYGGELSSAQTFSEDGDGWWTARRVGLRYDA
ncbi:MAG TPA: cysteine dioxygenase family protein [Verrucomicrobiae bacterium]|nr:cysteine dioxygenase family protein [Verrucomicrobiae bacterium]